MTMSGGGGREKTLSPPTRPERTEPQRLGPKQTTYVFSRSSSQLYAGKFSAAIFSPPSDGRKGPGSLAAPAEGNLLEQSNTEDRMDRSISSATAEAEAVCGER